MNNMCNIVHTITKKMSHFVTNSAIYILVLDTRSSRSHYQRKNPYLWLIQPFSDGIHVSCGYGRVIEQVKILPAQLNLTNTMVIPKSGS